jgi:CheY-like chemotaxis protein
MEEEVARARHLEALGTLAGGIAHDFNNLLTGIRGALSLGRAAAEPDSELHEVLTVAEKESLRASSLAEQLLTFAKGGAPVRKAAGLGDIIADSATFALSGSNVRAEFDIPADLWAANVDEGQISQVIRNLIRNADEAMPDGGVVRVSAENVVLTSTDPVPAEPGKYVRVSIRDDGGGMREKDLQRAFDPYFTTKDDGTGLGLTIAHSIVVKHGGHLGISSETGRGTTVRLHLPAAANKSGPSPVADAASPSANRGRVLFVDDETAIVITQSAILRSLGYNVQSARDGREAVSMYEAAKRSGAPFDVVLMDLTLPGGMGGAEATRELLDADPDARVIVSSGYSNDPVMANFRDYGFVGVVPKPYSAEQLAQALDAAMHTAAAADPHS